MLASFLLERILDDAFERGVLTVNEAKETLSQLYAYTGFPRSLNALASLQKVVAERRKKKQERGGGLRRLAVA